MKIYTRKGDQGETGLPGGGRVAKDAPRLETCGTIEELSTVLGMVRAEPLTEDVDRLLERVQHELFTAGAEVSPGPAAQGTGALGPKHVQAIEEAIDWYQKTLQPLGEFILPAGTRAAAALHLARAVCRRAERRVVTLARDSRPEIAPNLTAYLNRLGDLLFVLARTVNARAGRADVPREKRSG